MQYKDISIVRKTTKILELHFTKSGQNEDITGWTVYFCCKSNVKDIDANAKISKTVTSHSAPTDGKTLITLEPSDTDITAGNYYYEVSFKDDDDQEGVLFSGKLRISEPILKTRS